MKTYLLQKLFHPVICIIALWFIFCIPYFFHNKVPFSSTYQVTTFAPWSAYPQNGIPVKNGAMPDVITQIYPWRYEAISLWKHRQLPLWNMSSFGGTPLLANYQSAVLSPLNVLFFFTPFVEGWSLLVLFQPLLAGIGMYLFARQVGVSKWGGLLSSISFMFCGFLVVWMGYATLGYALLFLPYALTGLEGFFSTKQTKYLFLLSFSLPLSFFSGHFQISLYVLLATLAYYLYKSFQKKSLFLSLFSGIALFSGILLCLPQILPSLEFYTQSLRSGLFQKGEAIPLAYLPTLLAPDFLGNPVTRNDWFGHYAEWNMYIGIIPFFLALFSLTLWKKSIVRFAFVTGILCVLLALDTPITDVFVRLHIPVLSTSALSRIVGVYSFFFALLAGFGLDSLYHFLSDNKKKIPGLLMGFVIIAFGLLWIVIAKKLFLPLEKIPIAKQNLILPTSIALGFILCLFIGMVPQKRVKYICFVLLLCFVAFDMYRFVTKWQSFDPKNFVYENVPVTQAFSRIAGYERVLGNFGAQVSDYYKLPGLEGYDALYPRRYGEFIASLNDGEFHEADRSVVTFPRQGLYTSQVLNLLNVKYLVHKVSDDNMGWTLPYWNYPSNQFSPLYTDASYRILENTSVYPRAFLVGNYVLKQKKQSILDTMFAKDTDLRRTVVLEEKPNQAISEDTQAHTKIVFYKANNVKIQTSAKTAMLLFISDQFYPGWKAFMDGQDTHLYRADFAFRAVEVPAGVHTIVFSYQPTSFYMGLWGACIGLVALLASVMLKKKLFSPKL